MILGVNASTLSRRSDLAIVPRGRAHCLQPTTVMELARYYKRRSVLEVAGELADLAETQSPQSVEAIEREIEATFEGRSTPGVGAN